MLTIQEPEAEKEKKKEKRTISQIATIISAVNTTRVQCLLLNVSVTHDFLGVRFINI